MSIPVYGYVYDPVKVMKDFHALHNIKTDRNLAKMAAGVSIYSACYNDESEISCAHTFSFGGERICKLGAFKNKRLSKSKK